MGDTSMLSDLEHLVSPFVYSSETRVPDVDRNILPRNKNLQGFISEDCKWGCYYNNATIQCYSVDTKISDYHYVPKSQSHASLAIPTAPFSFLPRSVITCATELAIHKQRSWGGGVNRILIGLDCSGVAPAYNTEGCEGALAIYDQVQQQIVKWIPLPEPVTTLKVISHHESSESIKPFFNGAMMAMVGIAAVGLKGGKVIVLDLGLDKTEFIPSSNMVLFSSVASRRQSKPFMITDVNPFERLIATNRHMAIRNNQLISFVVGDPENLTSEDVFKYCTLNGSAAIEFVKEEVEVTAIDYVPNIGCLLIGFSFGGFQLWRVDDLSLQFSAEVPESVRTVLGFGFQQPVDDPKNFCYLWVLYGTQTYQMGRAKLDLHQLFFLEKSHIENFGFIYSNLHKCGINLSIALEDVFLPPDVLDSSEEEDQMRRYSVHPLRLWIRNELLFVSWNVTRSEIFYVGIFDLNQWYSSHTAARIPSGGLCPFWVTIPVEPPKPLNSLPWDFRLVPSTIQRWENQFKQVDIHFYPASITFQGICLTMRGYYTFEHFGIQEKIIRLILKEGHSLLAEPGVTREFCYSYGLQPFIPNAYEAETLPEKDADRFYIFTAILESKRPSLIVKMANAWVDGSFTNVGCTVDLIIEWIRNLSLSVRYLAEQHWHNVFNLTAERMLPETKKFLVYSNFVWNSLQGLLNILLQHDDVYNVARTPILDDLRLSLKKLVQFSAAILMFYQAEILPTNQFIISTMMDYHKQRRVVVKDALNRSSIVPEEIKKDCFHFVIDQMISAVGEDLVRQEWNLEPGDPLYPPPHSAYVVNMIMWRHVDLKLISRVIFYFLIDFLSVAGFPSSKLKGDFAAVVQLSPEEQQDVYNLWHVDHGFFDDAIAYIAQNPRFNGRDASAVSWSTAVTIMSAFKSADAIADLLKMGCPPLLGKLYVSVLSHHKQLYKKLLNDICVSAVMQETEVLQHFFRVAMDVGFLLEFIHTKLSDAPPLLVEELISFLQKNHGFDHQSLLLSCYIRLENIDSARQVYNSMKSCWGDGALLTPVQRKMWDELQNIMNSHEMNKKHNVIMEFLTMKKQKSVVKPSAPMVAIKPKRIVPVPVPERKKAFNVNAEHADMSPLRRFVPKNQTLLDSPDDSLNESQEGEKQGVTPSRRSKAFDIEAVLKTPQVDHRKSWREMREGSVNNSLYETPPPGEDMHSILKKSDGSVRNKSLFKTRFIDPSSGKELASPTDGSPFDTFNLAVIASPGGANESSSFNESFPFQIPQRNSPPVSVDESLKVNVDSDSCDTASDKEKVRIPFDLDAALSGLREEEETTSVNPPRGLPEEPASTSSKTAEDISKASTQTTPSPVKLSKVGVEHKKTVIHVTRIHRVTYREEIEEEEEPVVVPEDVPGTGSVSVEEPATPEEVISADSAEHKVANETGGSDRSGGSLYFSPTDDEKHKDLETSLAQGETPMASKTKLLFEDSNIEETGSPELKPAKHDQAEIEISVMESPTPADTNVGNESRDDSIMNATSISEVDLGPRRLTRSQKALLETILEARDSPGGTKSVPESLRTPKTSPAKEKSPSRSSTRSKRGKSKESVASSEEGSAPRRRTSSRSRRSETPESDVSASSERPLTRSAAKKLEVSMLETSGSPSSVDSSSPEKKPKTRRSRGKTPVKSLMPIFEEGSRTEEQPEKEKKPRAPRRKAAPRAQSEPPVTTATAPDTPKRRRGKVFDYAPELSTVLEISDSSGVKTPTRQSAKRRRPSAAESHADESEVLEASLLDSSLQTAVAGTSKRTRRSETPTSQVSDAPPPTRRRRRASSVK